MRASDQDHVTTLHTGHVDVRNFHSVFLVSSSLTNYHSQGPMGIKSVLAKVPITTVFGDQVQHQHSGLIFDHVDVGSLSLRTLQFALRDGWNQPIDLRGGNVLFTLIFAEPPLV